MFLQMLFRESDRWIGKSISELNLPSGVIVATIKRKDRILIPRGDIILKAGDNIVLGAEPVEEHEYINLKEII